MRKPLTTLVIVGSLLGGCGYSDSNWNPANWFGWGQPDPVAAEDGSTANPLIPNSRRARKNAENAVYVGTPINSVTELKVERIPGGAIIRATGVSGYQGGYNAFLLPLNEEGQSSKGVLTFRFDIQIPAGAQSGGPTATREVTVARRVTDQDLVGIRSIRVESRTNALASRR